MEGKSDTHPITIGHIYFCCYLVHFTLVWFAFCCLQSVRLMSPLAVVSVVFSRKCLTFQAQQAVIDILNPIKCGPRLDCRLVAVTLSFFPHCPCLPYWEWRKRKWACGDAALTFWVSKHNSLVTTHSHPTISRKACRCPCRTETEQPDLYLLRYFCTAHSFIMCCSTSEHRCQVTGTSRGMEQVPGLRRNGT